MIDNNKVKIARNAQRTSVMAAERALPRSGTKRRLVYDFIERCGMRGATDDEIQATLNIDGNTVRPTRGSLVEDGYIIDTGTTRKNKHGNECIVWRCADQGMLL
jgi:transcription initiation factor IIE alpha subunit